MPWAWKDNLGMAADAVDVEPVSTPDSLLTGKNTGKNAESRHGGDVRCPVWERVQWLTAIFPTKKNRERYSKNRELLRRNREI
jgi:hypothetical protein